MKPVQLTAATVRAMLPKRPKDSHKGKNGHVLVVAGSRGMSGAAVLTARGALRIGAGLVTVAIVDSERRAVTTQIPEALTLGLAESNGTVSEPALSAIQAYLKKRRVDVIAGGPGLSVNPAVTLVLKGLLAAEQPLVLDADGLNSLSLNDMKGRSGLIITPHVGELARLTGSSADAVQQDRAALALKLAREYQLICVLKGLHTVISDGQKARVNPTGNAAMATGGMGDVLTGAIAGLLGQKLAPLEAACAGVYLHGLAGDLAHVSDRGLLATDVADALPRALAKIGVK